MARLVVPAMVALALVACGGSESPQQRHSWRATGELVASAWRRGDVPRRYATDTLRVVESHTHDPAVAATLAAIGRGDRDAAPPR